MSSRHTRRKSAKAKQLAKAEGIAQAARSYEVAAIVKANKSSPIERNYYRSSPMGRLAEYSHRGYVARNSKGLDYLPKGTVAHGFNRG
jgi:hypothetical protein